MTITPIKKRRTFSKSSRDYIDNVKFSEEIHKYVQESNKLIAEGKERKQVPFYIADSFMKLCYRVATMPNFSGYSFRDEMIGDGIENCLRAVMNYDNAAFTRTGMPNAFSYFTKIIYYAYVRRIKKENKQVDLRNSIIRNQSVDAGAFFTDDTDAATIQNYAAQLTNNLDKYLS